jgi:hypothetical protein
MRTVSDELRIVSSSSWRSGGIRIVIAFSMTSSVAQPNSRPAPLLQLVMMRLTVLLIYGGTADSTMEASHIRSKRSSASPSWMISLVAAR